VDGQKPTDSQLFTYKGGDVTRNFYGYEIINGKKSLDFSPIARSF
jgi:hypothetical protein